jgi:acyl transferase domain-containing protein/NADPH:quinone reductase-like Zn-dependent oxidoreductase/thioesterase domain-containing protein/NADP-dependent 3-hydroxy acid dehydrogenase YdfG/acyl carrier protein
MSDLAERLANLSPAQRQLLEQRLAKARQSGAEPIAIVGMACRFPGAPDLSAYWRLIRDCQSAVHEVPPDRWNADEFFDPTGETPGRMSVKWAALIDGPDQFDPQFFGITPREAARMDPQQRLLLEVAWEAMENAGIPADRLAGSRTGVFVGIGGTDYSKLGVPYDNYYQLIDAHMGTGNALSIAANRLSYIFDFHGPSAAVDTACSSSSLAIHFAVESLRRGEADAALAGGVNMILAPETTIAFSKARMLSPEGVCRPFDSRADGYVRGEGCGLVLLKRLADAERDGDNVLAVLRATSANQDGRTSGISAPNGKSQQACIRAALKQAGLTPDDIHYVEAHGTGTPLGDPIEMQALTEIFRTSDKAEDSCYVASVKANVGHMETVSGVAGLIKVVLMMQHEAIVAQTHFETLNTHIRLDGSRLAIPLETIAWPASKGPRRAGISSFGFGGTNTHLVVESDSAAQRAASAAFQAADGPARPVDLLKLSAKSEAALVSQAERLAEFIESEPHAALADICSSANVGRVDFNYRAVVAAKNADELQQGLKTLSGGKTAPIAGVTKGVVRTIGRPKVAMLFTGQGLQYLGMGRSLYETQPVFRRVMDDCDAILREAWGGGSLLNIVYRSADSHGANGDASLLDQTQYTQPALFALEWALVELWASWGVTPDIVLGHSVGEYAAACAAGVMNFADGLRLIAERARLMQNVRRHGKMAVVFASPARVEQHVKNYGDEVVVAVLNGPENTVISGDAAAVASLSAELGADGLQVKPLNVSHAFHSPLMDEMLDDFERFAARIEYHEPRLPLGANLTGQVMTTAPTARYWRNHLRSPVQFVEGMNRVAEAKPAFVIEIGPTASLLGMGRRCLPQLEAAWLPSLRQGHNDWHVIGGSLAEYYVRGGHVDWRGWDKPWPRRHVTLPTYPFQRSRHWLKLDPAQRRTLTSDSASGSVGGQLGAKSLHPLLGSRLSTVWTNSLFEARLGVRSPAYFADHQVQGSPVAPAAAYVEQALAAAEQVFGAGRHGVANLVIQQAMFLPEGTRRRVQISVAPESSGEAAFEIYSIPEGDEGARENWVLHASGTLLHESRVVPSTATERVEGAVDAIDIAAARDRAVSITSQEDFYAMMAERGLVYGPAFRVLSDLHRGTEDAIATVTLPDSVLREAARYRLHPVLGDAILQVMAGAVPLEDDGSFSPFTYMPIGVGRVQFTERFSPVDGPMFVYAWRTSSESGPSPERVVADFRLLNASGEVLVAMDGVQVQRLGRSADAAAAVDTSRWLYRLAWEEKPLRASPVAPTAGGADSSLAGSWLIFTDERGLGAALAVALAQRGEASVVVKPGGSFARSTGKSSNGQPLLSTTVTIDPLDESHYRQLIDTEFAEAKRRCLGAIHLWSLDIAENERTGVDPSLADPSRVERFSSPPVGCGSVLQLCRTLVRTPVVGPPKLWLVTAGAQCVESDGQGGDAAASTWQSPLVGFARVAAIELADLRPRLIDLDPVRLQQSNSQAAALAHELFADDGEGQIAYRGGKRLAARLVRDPSILATIGHNDSSAMSLPAAPYQLRTTQAGSLDALRFVGVDREPPAAGQVEIEVHATGLNFSDVLKALGLYPGIKDAIVPLGIEGSGVVTAVGEGVERFRVGDEVFGVVPYAFGSHARTAEYALVHKPGSLSHEEACTIPVTFLTAYYALVRLAQLQRGERVLIHAGAGGVGLAAIQIAQRIGAEVFATAGSETKREFLASLGVRHVFSSRSSAFAEEILQATNRQGVDVVLNSLPGEAISKSLSILRAYGRFLEIGKTDIYQNRMIGLSPFQDNLSYFAIDLDRMLRQRPDYVRELFADVMRDFETGDYKPLNYTRFDASNTIESFRYMSQRKNIGKVVVSMAGQRTKVKDREPEISASTLARRDGAYLISGGTGALGLRVAHWLAGQGAGMIVLLSRRGASPEAEAAIDDIRKLGAEVVVAKGDVADAASLAAAMARLPATAPPLRGVIHAAGVLADGSLSEMTLEQLEKPMAPKVGGAWNLHRATFDKRLDFFVLFSSAASVLGSPGQANYAAGNAFLDALAHARRRQGLPALSINWGPWAGSGMVAEAGRSDAVKSRGMSLIEPQQGLALLGQLLRAGATQVAVMDAQWSDMLALFGSRRPALLEQIAADLPQSGTAPTGSRVDQAFRNRLLTTDASTRQSLVAEYIRQELSRIIGVEPAGLELNQPLSTFGLDSLLALELKNNLESRLDFTLPMAKLMEGPSIASLSAETARLLSATATPRSDESAQAERWAPLLALRSSGSRPPLVLLPALGGDVRCYADLVQELGDDQPVYAFRPRGADQELPPHLTIDEMMADYLAALREFQPTGPYCLAGWSTGGIFAFALAAALERAGDEVALLAMFDSPVPSICDDVDVEDDVRFLCDLVNYTNRFSGSDMPFTYEDLAALPPEARFPTALEEARRRGVVPAETPESIIRRLVHVGEANVRAIQSYAPRPLRSRVQLFVPFDRRGLAEVSGRVTSPQADNGWSEEVGQTVELHELPGDHFTIMLGEGAVKIASILASQLRQPAAVGP